MALNFKVFSVNYKLCATNYKVNRASHNGRNIHATVLFSGSWFVNACHYTRMGCGEITLAGSHVASPYVRPLAVFLRPVTCGLHLFFIACMRFRRGRPDFSGLSIAGYFPGRTVAAGGPLRAEGCPKRRCQFESVAAQPHLSPRKGLKF